MKSSGNKCPSQAAGYSLVEMMMTLVIGLILVSVALPTMIGAIQAYRLSGISQQVANLIELTRYTAIRRNSVMSLQSTVMNGNRVFYIDLNANGLLDANEPMVMLPSDMQLANGQPLTPDASSTRLVPTQDFAAQLTFDYRGTVNFPVGGPVAAYFLALGYVNQAQYGCRAITVTPMGQTKMWKAPASGTWTGM
ncbi:MAG TPA: GspH/FimT family pseudopilin [Candidatus Acidoferrum sp.]|nr:GspH/FimT family pseudopilin [Candidatus Acidoferrum sp.]